MKTSRNDLKLKNKTGEEAHSNHRQLLRYEKTGLESSFGTKKKHILKNN
jgi:hypothetical protein